MTFAVLLAFTSLFSSDGAKVGADVHLLTGAQAFREARYQEALVEFRVAQKLGATGAAAYTGASLVKLGRAEDAVEAFALAPRGDALLDYYRALACHDARLYSCAARLLEEVEGRAGPKISDLATRLRAAIRAVLAAEPSREAIEWYLARCTETEGAGRLMLADAYCREASDLSERRPDRHRKAEAVRALERVQRKANPARSP